MVEDDMVILDTVPAKLLPPNKTEDCPEIFKRVRFITRWEDFEESRGRLDWSSGGVSCRSPAVGGPAWDPVRKIEDAAAAALTIAFSSVLRESGVWVVVGI